MPRRGGDRPPCGRRVGGRPGRGGPGSAPSACPGTRSRPGPATRSRSHRRWPASFGDDAVDVEVLVVECHVARFPVVSHQVAVPPPEMLRGAPPPPRRWRKASKQTTAQATPTFSDSARPAIGIRQRAGEGARQLGIKPGRLVAQEHGRRGSTSPARRNPRLPVRRWPVCGNQLRVSSLARAPASGRTAQRHVEQGTGRRAHRLGVVGVD